MTRPCRILVVDDHMDTAELFARLLRRLGHVTESARTCAEARDAAAGERPDVVVSDVGLPDGDGLALLAELKTRYGCATMAVTGFVPADADYTPPGVDAYFLKPVDFPRLRSAVDSLCDGLPHN